MPGVRGSSRGCNTCKKRKVLCDFQRPDCSRCTRAGIKCAGYDKTATFVNRDASNIQSSGRKTLAAAFKVASKGREPPAGARNPKFTSSYSSSTLPPLQESLLYPEQNEPRSQWARFEDAARAATVSVSLKDLQVLRSTSNSRGPILGLLNRYCVAEGSALHQAQLYTSISQFLEPTEIFDYAVSATALTRCGQVNNDDRVAHQGTAQYVKAMTKLRIRINDTVLVHDDETLAVSLLLSAHELINGTGRSLAPWLRHMEGLSGLILMRGPESLQTALAHQIFLHYRANAALRAVLTRKSSFLSSPKWRTVPFEKAPKDVFHRLMDLVFEMCSILEAFDEGRAKHTPSEAFLFQLVQDCHSLHARFQNWFENTKLLFSEQKVLISQAPGYNFAAAPLYTEIPAYIFVPEDEPPAGLLFSTFLDFPDLAIAQTLMNYWGVFLILQTTTGSILNVLGAVGAKVSPSSPAAVEACSSIAVLIAKTVPYCLQSRFKTAGPMAALHAFSVAMQWFEHVQAERELRWCREVFAKLNVSGNPFESPQSGKVAADGHERASGEIKRDGGAAAYQLKLQNYGRGAMRMDF